MKQWMAAAEAARVLGVSRATLYAYVSRGYVRSQPTPGPSRDRRYSREDVERLRRRTEERREPDKAAARALQWGMPILESSIALIDGQRLYYRGHDAVELSRSRSVAEVASLVWTGRFDTTFAADSEGQTSSRPLFGSDLPFLACAQSALAAASSRDPSAFDLRPAGVARTGWQHPADADKGRRAIRPHGSDNRAHARPRVGRAGARSRTAAQRADPVRRSRAQRILLHGALRRVGRLESLRRGHRRAGRARRDEAWRRERARRVDTPVDPAGTTRPSGGWRAARARRIDRWVRPSSVSGWRSARDGALRDAPRTIRRLCRARLRFRLRSRGDSGSSRRTQHRFCAGGGVASFETSSRIHAVDLRNRPDHRLDWSRHRAIRDGAADSSAREVRRRSCPRRCRPGGVSIGLSSEV